MCEAWPVVINITHKRKTTGTQNHVPEAEERCDASSLYSAGVEGGLGQEGGRGRYGCTDLACFIACHQANERLHSVPKGNPSTTEYSTVLSTKVRGEYSASCTRGFSSAPKDSNCSVEGRAGPKKF